MTGEDDTIAGANTPDGERRVSQPQPNDLSRSLTALEQDRTLIAVIEMSQSSWLVAGIVPGIERQPLKKLARLSQLTGSSGNFALRRGR
jgi:hypothetical protein